MAPNLIMLPNRVGLRMCRCLSTLLLLAGLLWPLALPGITAEPKRPPKKDLPAVTVVAPLGAVPGNPTRLTIRGLKLDTATEVRFHEPKTVAKILQKRKTPVPNKQEAAKVGDTQIEAQILLPPDLSSGEVSFVIVSPAGESAPHRLLVTEAASLVAEKEPNNGFRQAQAVSLPVSIDGRIGQPQDVDVYRFEGRAGQQVLAEIAAARYGSALDSILTLYDADGNSLAVNDDAGGTADSRLEATLPRSGTYFLSVMDAHDDGGPAHVYRLSIRVK